MYTAGSAFAMAVLGGLSANVGLMKLNSMHKGCANVCTLLQFLFGFTDTLIHQPKKRQVLFSASSRTLPLWLYFLFAFMFFIGPYLGNASTAITNSDFYPVFLVVRSCGSVASMALGYLFAGKRYSSTQVAAVLAITMGAGLTTYGCYVAKASGTHSSDAPTPNAMFLVGFALLVANLLNDAGLGVIQQRTFAKFGDGSMDEAMVFMSGIGTLLMALIAGPEVLRFLRNWLAQPTWYRLSTFQVSIPLEFAFLVVNVVGNWNAKKIQVWLNGHSSAVIGAMVPMMYRLLSTVLSSTVLNTTNVRPPVFTWIGIMLVFVGSLVYLLAPKVSSSNEKQVKDK